MKKRLLKHAFLMLTLAFILGLVTGFAHGERSPTAKAWLIAHITGIMLALLMAMVGFAWSELKLGARAAKVLYWSTVPANWVVMLMLGILAPALGASPSLAVPEAPPAPAGVQAMVTVGIILASVASFLMAGIAAYGLRERAAVDSPV